MGSTGRIAGIAALLAACAAAGACTKKGEYAQDGDTGAAAPATKRDMSETVGAPDSTDGINQRTGRPAVAGDTSARRDPTQTPRPRPRP